MAQEDIMASIEFITKRIEGKKKEIAKLEKKLERIHKAEATGWEVNPYYYHESDLTYTTRDLEAAKKALAAYEEQLITEGEKAASRNVKAIIDFLEAWKARVREYYRDAFDRFLVARAEYYKKSGEYTDWFNHDGHRVWREDREAYKAKDREYKELRDQFHKTWNFIMCYVERDTFLEDKFERELKQDAEAKYDDIINRTNEICGKIVDATGLSVGPKGELDGIVIGERGNAKVQTIGAGGYNIQCYHFRTLIHEVKGEQKPANCGGTEDCGGVSIYA